LLEAVAQGLEMMPLNKPISTDYFLQATSLSKHKGEDLLLGLPPATKQAFDIRQIALFRTSQWIGVKQEDTFESYFSAVKQHIAIALGQLIVSGNVNLEKDRNLIRLVREVSEDNPLNWIIIFKVVINEFASSQLVVTRGLLAKLPAIIGSIFEGFPQLKSSLPVLPQLSLEEVAALKSMVGPVFSAKTKLVQIRGFLTSMLKVLSEVVIEVLQKQRGGDKAELQREALLQIQQLVNQSALVPLFKESLDLVQGKLAIFGSDAESHKELLCFFEPEPALFESLVLLHEGLATENSVEECSEFEGSLPELARMQTQESVNEGESVASLYLQSPYDVNLSKCFRALFEKGLLPLIVAVIKQQEDLGRYSHFIRSIPQNEFCGLSLKLRLIKLLTQGRELRPAPISDSQENKLFIQINRGRVWEDTVKAFLGVSPHELQQKQLFIEFDNEPGIDWGGLTREWLGLLQKSIFSPDFGIFELQENGRCIQPSVVAKIDPEGLLYLRIAGRIVAKAILEEWILNINFTMSFLKHILSTFTNCHTYA